MANGWQAQDLLEPDPVQFLITQANKKLKQVPTIADGKRMEEVGKIPYPLCAGALENYH